MNRLNSDLFISEKFFDRNDIVFLFDLILNSFESILEALHKNAIFMH
jgi:hypothetical protein